MKYCIKCLVIAIFFSFIFSIASSHADSPVQPYELRQFDDSHSIGHRLYSFEDKVFFGAPNDAGFNELWGSDGTAEGTKLVKNINPDGNADIFTMVKTGENLYFFANDGVHGYELWKSDGTEAGTQLVKDVTPSGDSNVVDMKSCGNEIYFSLNTGGDIEIWKSDGTEAGTVLVKTFADHFTWGFYSIGNEVFFLLNNEIGEYRELWKSDGTEAGTQLVKNFGDDQLYNIVQSGNTIYLTTFNHENSYKLWESDGTLSGTITLKTFEGNQAVYMTGPESFPFYFFTTLENQDYRLWKTDNTSEGTIMYKDLGNITPTVSAIAGNKLYFSSYDESGNHLWISDGTENGTNTIHDFGDQWPQSFTGFNGAIYYLVEARGYGYDLWKTAGTESSMIKSFRTSEENRSRHYFEASDLVSTNNTIFWTLKAGDIGSLWAYRDIAPTFVNLPGTDMVINVSEGQTITTNPFVIKVKPQSPYGIAKVEFFIDDNLICTATTPDADGVYSCPWDTSLYHSNVKVIAYDPYGNHSEELQRTTTVDLTTTPTMTELPATGR